MLASLNFPVSTGAGPVIDREAFDNIQKHLLRLKNESKPLLAGELSAQEAINLIAPQMLEVKNISDLQAEIFGPVLQVVRYGGDPQSVFDKINALGYGLTLGLQTRIDSRAQALAANAVIGNVYFNRSIIGAAPAPKPAVRTTCRVFTPGKH